jgi:hypothetical protein
VFEAIEEFRYQSFGVFLKSAVDWLRTAIPACPSPKLQPQRKLPSFAGVLA